MALAHDDALLGEGGPDDFGGVDRSVRQVQEQLRLGGDGAFGREDEVPELRPGLGAAGLARGLHPVAEAGEPVHEQACLGRLPGAVDSLNRYEEAGHRYSPIEI